MKRILLIIESPQIQKHVLDFACYIANLAHAELTGYFVEKFKEDTIPKMKMVYGFPYVETIVADDLPENKLKMEGYDEYMSFFRKTCSQQHVNYTLQRSINPSKEEIIAESRFADLVIIDGETPAEHLPDITDLHELREVLIASECPVIIAPSEFKGINEIFFAYDGSRSAVFAIKQFTYLFSALRDRKITILQVNEAEGQPLAAEVKIKGWISTHYYKWDIRILEGSPEEQLYHYLLNKENSMVVMGAFGRNKIASLFKHSAGEQVIQMNHLPVFIAHC
jgi:hypothetical protein